MRVAVQRLTRQTLDGDHQLGELRPPPVHLADRHHFVPLQQVEHLAQVRHRAVHRQLAGVVPQRRVQLTEHPPDHRRGSQVYQHIAAVVHNHRVGTPHSVPASHCDGGCHRPFRPHRLDHRMCRDLGENRRRV
jgi:hypothetical protein